MDSKSEYLQERDPQTTTDPGRMRRPGGAVDTGGLLRLHLL